MCGIVGYTGPRQAAALVLEGLRRLEYRGYDSAGLALIEDGRIEVHKAAGKIGVLEKALGATLPAGHTGIAHTRWATHGAPNTVNAHPHTDCGGTLALVHNGIIENAGALRTALGKRGHVFRSETDTEGLAHLIGGPLPRGRSPGGGGGGGRVRWWRRWPERCSRWRAPTASRYCRRASPIRSSRRGAARRCSWPSVRV